MKTFLSFLILILLHLSVSAQIEVADSLIQLVDEAEGIEKANLYNDAANKIMGFDPQTGYEYAQKALAISKEENDDDVAYYSMLTMGNALYNKGQFDKTLELDLQILAEYAETLSQNRLAQLHTQLGNDYQTLNSLEKAMEHLLLALDILEQIEDNEKQDITNGAMFANHVTIGSVCTKLENYQKAEEHFQMALALSVRLGDSLRMAFVYNNIAVNFQEQGKDYKAIENYLKAIELIEKFGSAYDLATLCNNILSIYLSLGDYQLALKYGNKALGIAEEVNHEHIICKISNNIGKTYIEMNKPDEAFAHIQRAMDLSRKNAYTELLIDCNKFLAQYYALKGSYKAAYEARNLSVAISDSLYDFKIAETITEMQTKYETEKKEQEIALLTKDTEIKDLRIKRQQAFTYSLIGVFVIILLVGYLWFSRTKEKQKREKLELEKINLQTEQKLLRAQINPHFMFNALNSVQSYISGNDNLKAMSYLAKFSQLMRNILENSRKSMITIEEEVNTLTLYMELEAMRFKDAFEFEIRISDNIVPSRTYIPPMLIQPFVENSIKHGFRNLDRKGRLLIDFFAMKGALSCKIEDNGIGRVKAQEQNQNTNIYHKSLGMVVIRERLMALSKARKVKAKCEIEDLETGTRVLMDMPYEVE